jgi:hypothetical protein
LGTRDALIFAARQFHGAASAPSNPKFALNPPRDKANFGFGMLAGIA